MIHHCCRVQARVTLSTREAELYEKVRGLREMLNMKYVMEELRLSYGRARRCIIEVASIAGKEVLFRESTWPLGPCGLSRSFSAKESRCDEFLET